jgi:hypothetical protein
MGQPSTREAQVVASLVNGVRRALIEDGTWERIEHDVLEREPMVGGWLNDADHEDWVSLEGHLVWMQALFEVLGREELERRGAERLRTGLDTGPLARLLRSWLREYACDPRDLFRVAPHAWLAITRYAGRMVLVDSSPTSMRFRVEGAPPGLATLPGWHALLTGFGQELLATTGRHGSLSIGADVDGVSLALAADWSADAG